MNARERRERMGHQDRTYASRIKRLRDRVARVVDPGARAALAGTLDVLADLVADQEEAQQ